MKLIGTLAICLLFPFLVVAQEPVIIDYITVNSKLYGLDSTGHFHRLPYGRRYYGNDPLPKPIDSKHIQEGDVIKVVTQTIRKESIPKAKKLFSEKLRAAGSTMVAGGLFMTIGFTLLGASVAYQEDLEKAKRLNFAGIGFGASGAFLTTVGGIVIVSAGKSHNSEAYQLKLHGSGLSFALKF